MSTKLIYTAATIQYILLFENDQ